MSFEDAVLHVGLLIVVAKLLEALFSRVGVNAIIAWTLTGVLLGPATGVVHTGGELSTLLGIGIFLFFFLIGLDEIDISGFVATLKGRFFLAAFACVIVSLLSALVVTTDVLYDFNLGPRDFSGSLALAGVFALSSLGLVAKVLSDNGQLRKRLGMEIFAVVLIAELLVLLVVGFSIGEPLEGPLVLAVGVLLAEIAGFTVLTWVLSKRVVPYTIVFMQRFLPVSQLSLGLILGGLFLMVIAAEHVGLHGSLGALLFGASLSGLPHQVRRDILPGLRSIGEGLFVPLFFASAGLHFSWSFVELPAWTIAALVVLPLIGKFAGAAIGAYLVHLKARFALATGLMAKGVAEIAVLLVLVESGVIGDGVFSLCVLIMFGYILVTPSALGFAVRRAQRSDKTSEEGVGEIALTPALARFALDGVTVDAIVDKTRHLPDAGISVRAFADRWVVPDQEDYVVTTEGRLAGIVSLRMLRYLPKPRWPDTSLSEVLRRDTPHAWPEEPIEDALQRMTDNAVTAMPVVDSAGEFVGMVTSLDILDLLVMEAKGEG